jgi:microcompartment protein CcmL/EutN
VKVERIVDVVSERFFSKFIKMIEADIDGVQKSLQTGLPTVRTTIKRLYSRLEDPRNFEEVQKALSQRESTMPLG